MDVKEIKIPKGRGEFRVVYCPVNGTRRELEQLTPVVAAAERRLARLFSTFDVAHGFIQGRSAVTGAIRHVGMAVTISCDLASWFDSVTETQVLVGLASSGEHDAAGLASRICYKGAARQGLHTSPAACNLAAVTMDRAILSGLPVDTVYTRYADDLTVSLPPRLADKAVVKSVLDLLRDAAEAHHWKIKDRKTTIQWASAGRRVICGVAVDQQGVFAPRRIRRKLRAAIHQAHGMVSGTASRREIWCGQSASGLAEYCKMRLPNNPT